MLSKEGCNQRGASTRKLVEWLCLVLYILEESAHIVRVIRGPLAFFVTGNLNGLVKKRVAKDLAAGVLVDRLRADPKLPDHPCKVERNIVRLVLAQRFPRDCIAMQITRLGDAHLYRKNMRKRSYKEYLIKTKHTMSPG